MKIVLDSRLYYIYTNIINREADDSIVSLDWIGSKLFTGPDKVLSAEYEYRSVLTLENN